ncbi:MAG: hypothetical protein NDJ75_04530 [Thermoanaerobaculia bacterium]|nr:hypothetical protein [Thermoanaerobaculia bacterium]
MNRNRVVVAVGISLGLGWWGAGLARPAAADDAGLVLAADVAARLGRFARTEIAADLAPLTAEDRAVLREVLAAAREMDPIFRRQVSARNGEIERALAAADGPLAEPARELFRLMQGPWDRLDAEAPFVGDRPKPPGAGFYPEDLSKAEFEAWLTAHPGDRPAFTAERTVIVRDGAALRAVPYREAYRAELERAAGHLRAAAARTSNASLARFLTTRAAAFLSDDYFESDVAWMDLDAPVEVTIGPYETYEDGLFGYKAAYEAFVTVALPAESAALARYKERLPWLERNLPIPDEHKNLQRGTDSPIRVVDVVFTAGDANRGVKTIAFNLPNDERVREAKGSKKVLLRNVIRAKFDQILVPIAQRTLTPADAARVSFDAFFDEVLHHELSHGLGPGIIEKNGQRVDVRLELKELYSTLEEAKADVMGIYDILALIELGEMPQGLRETLDPTYVAGLFRSARFGVHEAHGQGVVAQFNYLLEKGALAIDAEGRYATVAEKFPGAIRDLLREMLMLQATGDYAGTRAFLDRYGHPTPPLEAAIARLHDVPVDLDAVYSQAAQLAR